MVNDGVCRGIEDVNPVPVKNAYICESAVRRYNNACRVGAERFRGFVIRDNRDTLHPVKVYHGYIV